MKLDELVDREGLVAALADGFVSRREHEGLSILNYTARCQYERGAWNDVTRQCRGLIYDTRTLEVVARPFPKFFNYGEPSAPTVDLSEPVTVTDKMDGSLGVLYSRNGEWHVATRGAFTSEQAIHATDLWRERYSDYHPPQGWTLLFEIVYPDNRIVVDYAAFDDLVLLGGIIIDTGQWIAPDGFHYWPGPTAETFPYTTLADAIAAPPRPNAEGLVVHVHATNDRLKIKQEDYVRLHRIIMQLNERSVWEHLRDGGTVEGLLDNIPDEFHSWVRETAGNLTADVEGQAAAIEHDYEAIVAGMPEEFTRKDFALRAKDQPNASGLFKRLEGKSYWPELWKRVRPMGARGPRGVEHTEESA